MKKLVILSLLALVIAGLISSCSKNDPVPDSPIVGQWDLTRFIVSDIPASYTSVSNGTYTYDATKTGIDSYTFKNDGTFTYTYANTSNTNTIINGTWSLAGTVLTATYTSTSGSSADVFAYNASTSEIISNKYAQAISLPNPTTQVPETVYYGRVDTYKKKTQ